ncbi:MAG: hypothetical protein KF878_20585 [Planctomycetes bacterium]|nr:hypothetical protein [Planctomycetota bacterium]
MTTSDDRSSHQARAARLAERVQAGELARERLELAAYLGHAAARQAVPRPRPSTACAWGLHGVDAFFLDLDAYGEEVRDRANLAMCRALLPRWQEQYPAEAWLGEWLRDEERRIVEGRQGTPEERVERASRLRERLRAFPPFAALVGRWEGEAHLEYHSFLFAMTLVAAVQGQKVGVVAFDLAGSRLHRRGRAWLRRVVRREVAPWALGEGDPLSARPTPGAPSAG